MAPQIPTTEPLRIIAGDTVKWTKVLAEYPPSEGWTLKYSLRGESAADVTASPDGSRYAIAIAASDTIQLEPGVYTLAGYVEGSGAFAGEQYEVHRSALVIEPSVENAEAAELQSEDEVMLRRIESEIRARVTGDGSAHDSYSIGGRSLSKIPLRELTQLAGIYRHRVWQVRNPGTSRPSHRVRFGAVA